MEDNFTIEIIKPIEVKEPEKITLSLEFLLNQKEAILKQKADFDALRDAEIARVEDYLALFSTSTKENYLATKE